TLDAGGNVTVVAGQNLAVTGSAVVAGGVARLAADHDLTVDPGTNRTLSVTQRSVAGVGIGASVDGNGVSTSAGYHSKSTTVAGDTTTAEASAIVGGTGVVITAGNDATLTATDIASGGDVTVAAGRNLSLLSQGQVSHSAVTRSRTVIGFTNEVSQNVSGAVNQLSGAVATAGSGHGGSGYQAIGAASGVMQATDGAMALTIRSAGVTVESESGQEVQTGTGKTARVLTQANAVDGDASPAAVVTGLSAQAGLGWMAQVAQGGAPVMDVGLTTQHRSWDNDNTVLSPAAQALIAVAASPALSGEALTRRGAPRASSPRPASPAPSAVRWRRPSSG
ncbi:hemagglutinin repeat-containing protein, partial [Methylobacterium aerolatum]